MSRDLRADPHLRAGAARAEIRLHEAFFPVEGFTGIRDPLHVRVLVLAHGFSRVAIVSVEITSLDDAAVQSIREVVSQRCRVDTPDVVVAATHTFSAPHLQPPSGAADAPRDELLIALLDAVARAAATACGHLRRVSVRTSSGTCRVAVNRDVETADGWWLGADDAAYSDTEVPLVHFVDEDAETVAVLFSYGVQSSVMNESTSDGGGRVVTADMVGAAARFVEDRCGSDSVALFLVGAAGDQAPYLTAHRHHLDATRRSARADLGSSGLVLVDLLGERLGAAAVDALARSKQCDVQHLRVSDSGVEVTAQAAPASFRELHPTRDHTFTATGSATVPYWLVEIGPVAVVGLQAELSSSTGRSIKDRSPFDLTLVTTMVNGAAKYLPDARSYQRMTYEAMSARYGEGSAEAVEEGIVDHLLRRSADARQPATHP